MCHMCWLNARTCFLTSGNTADDIFMWIYALLSNTIQNSHIKMNVYIITLILESKTIVGTYYHILSREKVCIAKHNGFAIYNDAHRPVHPKHFLNMALIRRQNNMQDCLVYEHKTDFSKQYFHYYSSHRHKHRSQECHKLMEMFVKN